MTLARPTSSRTGTTKWMRIRDQRREEDFNNGITNCPECGIAMDWEYSGRPNSAEVDHILSHSMGGTDTFENTRTCCRQCNQSLGGKLGKKRQVIQTVKVKYQTAIKW